MPPPVERVIATRRSRATAGGEGRVQQLLTARGGPEQEVVELLSFTFPQQEPRPSSHRPDISLIPEQSSPEVDNRRRLVELAHHILDSGLISNDLEHAHRLDTIYEASGEPAPTDLATRIVLEGYVRSRKEMQEGDLRSWGRFERARRNMEGDIRIEALEKDTPVRQTFVGIDARFENLTSRQRQAVELLYIDEVSTEEVAHTLQVGNIDALMRRVGRQLNDHDKSYELQSEAEHNKRMTDERIEDTLLLAKRGDAVALDQLLADIRPRIFAYCRGRMGGSSSTAVEDVVQEVALAVIGALPGYKIIGKPFLAFVYGVAGHKVVDHLRVRGRDRSDPVDELPDQTGRDTSEERALRGETLRELKTLLDGLPEKQREIFLLRVVKGLSAEETAEAVGSTAGAVRVSQHRALMRLRRAAIDSPLANSFGA